MKTLQKLWMFGAHTFKVLDLEIFLVMICQLEKKEMYQMEVIMTNGIRTLDGVPRPFFPML